MARNEIVVPVSLEDDFTRPADRILETAEELERPIEATVDADTDIAQRHMAEFRESVERAREEIEAAGNSQGLDRVGTSAGRARDGVRDLGDASDNSRSVLANLVGNSAQDLGEFGGIAGTAGMAVGQLAEYATEGNISLSGLAKTAGPMLAIGAAVGFITSKLAAAKKKAEETAAAAKSFAEALREGDAVAAAQGLTEEYSDLFDKADEAGVAVRDLSDALVGNSANLDAQAAAAREAADALLAQGTGTRATQEAWQAAEVHASKLEGLRDAAHEVTDAVEEESSTLDRNAAVQESLTEAIGRTQQATVEAEAAMRSYNAALDEEASFLSAVGDADALAGSLAEVARITADAEASQEELSDAQRAAAEDTNALKQTVLDLIEQYGEIPAEERTRILAELPAAEQAAFDAWLRGVEAGAVAPVEVVVDPASLRRAASAVNSALGGFGGFSWAGAQAAPSSQVNVTVYAPQGMRSDDVIAAATRYARRNGGQVLTRTARRRR